MQSSFDLNLNIFSGIWFTLLPKNNTPFGIPQYATRCGADAERGLLTELTHVLRVRLDAEGRDTRTVGVLNECGGDCPVKKGPPFFARFRSYACLTKTRVVRGRVPSGGQDQSAASPAPLTTSSSYITLSAKWCRCAAGTQRLRSIVDPTRHRASM